MIYESRRQLRNRDVVQRSSPFVSRLRRVSTLLVVAVAGLSSRAAFGSNLTNFNTIFSTDYVSTGLAGLRNTGAGNLVLSGVSGTVPKAYLYWQGPMNSTDPTANQTVTVDGTDVTGVFLGISNDNCWSYQVSQAWRADVTALVAAKGNGTYVLSNFIKTSSINVNGVSLVVFFNDGNPANNRDVVIFDGNDSNIDNGYDASGWNVTLSGINYACGSAAMQLHVSDGQNFTDGALVVNSLTLVPVGNIFNGDSLPSAGFTSGGTLWDIKTFDVTSFLTPGPTTLTLTSASAGDCLGIVVALIDLPSGAAPPPTNVCVLTCPGNITQATDQ